MTIESQRFQQALGRLEAAIERVERVATPPTPGAPDDRLAALEVRHRKLLDGATDALARLDRLIGEQS